MASRQGGRFSSLLSKVELNFYFKTVPTMIVHTHTHNTHTHTHTHLNSHTETHSFPHTPHLSVTPKLTHTHTQQILPVFHQTRGSLCLIPPVRLRGANGASAVIQDYPPHTPTSSSLIQPPHLTPGTPPGPCYANTATLTPLHYLFKVKSLSFSPVLGGREGGGGNLFSFNVVLNYTERLR